jgi:hypothetical protein
VYEGLAKIFEKHRVGAPTQNRSQEVASKGIGAKLDSSKMRTRQGQIGRLIVDIGRGSFGDAGHEGGGDRISDDLTQTGRVEIAERGEVIEGERRELGFEMVPALRQIEEIGRQPNKREGDRRQPGSLTRRLPGSAPKKELIPGKERERRASGDENLVQGGQSFPEREAEQVQRISGRGKGSSDENYQEEQRVLERGTGQMHRISKERKESDEENVDREGQRIPAERKVSIDENADQDGQRGDLKRRLIGYDVHAALRRVRKREKREREVLKELRAVNGTETEWGSPRGTGTERSSELVLVERERALVGGCVPMAEKESRSRKTVKVPRRKDPVKKGKTKVAFKKREESSSLGTKVALRIAEGKTKEGEVNVLLQESEQPVSFGQGHALSRERRSDKLAEITEEVPKLKDDGLLGLKISELHRQRSKLQLALAMKHAQAAARSGTDAEAVCS